MASIAGKQGLNMIERMEYMKKLAEWKDHPIIKVITGVRRSGKSTLLRMFRDKLMGTGVREENIISVNFEDIRFEGLLEYHKLYEYITEKLRGQQKTYIFLDEIQMVPNFQQAVNSLFLRDDVDIYITGSNAKMLSGELATLLSGRYVEIRILPFSFREYYEYVSRYQGNVTDTSILIGSDKRQLFLSYLKYGGFPYSVTLKGDIWRDYISGIYSTVLLKDIAAKKRISDIPLLETVIRFMADNVGNTVSVKKIADTLSSDGRKTTAITIDSYANALKEAFLIYEARRYDIKGKQHLRSLEKYYLVDLGLRSLLIGERSRDMGHILENVVYLELIRRGYIVSIGKVDRLEIDFVAEQGDERIYFQVAASVMDENTYEREFAPLKKIKDNYPKYVLTMDDYPMGEDGILQLNIIEWLLGNP